MNDNHSSSVPPVRPFLWKYRIAFGALMIVAGFLVALLMVRNEAEDRTRADGQQIRALNNEIAQRKVLRDAQYKEQQDQLQKLEKLAADQVRINDTQNDIIRALLRIRENDPDLFEGVVLPTVQEFNEAVGAQSKPSKSSGVTKPRKPKPTKPVSGGTPKPEVSKPTPSVTTPTPTPETPAPRPVAPAPTTPPPVVVVPPPVTPVPPRQPIIVVPPILPPAQPGPIVDPIINLPCRLGVICIQPIGL